MREGRRGWVEEEVDKEGGRGRGEGCIEVRKIWGCKWKMRKGVKRKICEGKGLILKR